MNQTPPPLELYTTILRVSDLDRSVEWYRDMLGLQPSYRDYGYRLVTMTGEKGMQVTLREAAPGVPVVPTRLNSAYVVFISPEVDAAHAHFSALGCKVGPVETRPGVRLFALLDPDGRKNLRAPVSA